MTCPVPRETLLAGLLRKRLEGRRDLNLGTAASHADREVRLTAQARADAFSTALLDLDLLIRSLPPQD